MLAPRGFTAGTIGVFAPSSPFTDERFARGLMALESLGFEVKVHPQTHDTRGFLAGTDEARTQALHDLLKDSAVGAIVAARGGYGVHRIIDRVEYDLVKRSRKPIVGFSDICALHSAIQKHAGLISIHGPVVTQLGELADRDRAAFVRALSGDLAGMRYQSDRDPIKGGKATGTLIGGCLAVMVPLVGSPYLFLPKDPILLLEDVGEMPYRVDRMLTHLHLAGILKKLRGVVLGDFVNCEAQKSGEQTIDEVLAERLEDLGVPVLGGFPFGHGKRNEAVPLGAKVTLDADAKTLTVEST
jgi:muramoyltetrapeptide carboxypeptidase